MNESRFWDGDEEGDVPWQLWARAIKNALQGRRGQAALRELREALLALPEKRLISGYVFRDGECCAIGALAAKRAAEGALVQASELYPDPPVTVEELEDRFGWRDDADAAAEFAKRYLGTTYAWAWKVAYMNDEHGRHDETPEQRYERILAWVEGQIQ